MILNFDFDLPCRTFYLTKLYMNTKGLFTENYDDRFIYGGDI